MWIYAWISIHKLDILSVVGFMLYAELLTYFSMIVLCYVWTLFWSLIHLILPQDAWHPLLGSWSRNICLTKCLHSLFTIKNHFEAFRKQSYFGPYIITACSFPAPVKSSAKETYLTFCLMFWSLSNSNTYMQPPLLLDSPWLFLLVMVIIFHQ